MFVFCLERGRRFLISRIVDLSQQTIMIQLHIIQLYMRLDHSLDQNLGWSWYVFEIFFIDFTIVCEKGNFLLFIITRYITKNTQLTMTSRHVVFPCMEKVRCFSSEMLHIYLHVNIVQYKPKWEIHIYFVSVHLKLNS